MFWRIVLLASLLAGGVAREIRAQPVPRVTLVLRGTALDEALSQLVERARIDLAYAPELVQGRHAYCVTRDALPEDALRCVLGGTGLDFYRLSNGSYVLVEVQEDPAGRGVLMGRVVDARTGRPLGDASVLLVEASAGTATDPTGQFTFPRVPPGVYEIRVSYVGYQPYTDTVRVEAAQVSRRTIALAAIPSPILPIVVDGLAARGHTGGGTRSSHPLLDVLSTSAPDVAQRMAQLPGIHVGNVTADVHVQGGAAGEHDLRLDGAPVFTPPILLNLVGPFSPFAIGQIEVQKAGFGAEPGSNTVGIVEATQVVQPGRPLRFDAQVDALSVNARLMASSPRAGRLMLTVREGIWDQYRLASSARFLRDWNRQDTFLRAIFSPSTTAASDPLLPYLDAPEAESDPRVGFRDLHGAYRAHVGRLSTVYVSGYLGKRAMRTGATVQPYHDRFGWHTHMAQATVARVLSSRLFAQLQVRTSHYRLQHHYVLADTVGVLPEEDGNTITETALEGRLDFAPMPGVLFEAGIAPTNTRDRFEVRSVTGNAIRHRSHMWRWATYASLRVRPLPQVEAELGFRATYVNDRGRFYPEPRVSLRYDSPRGILGQVSMRVGAGLYEQFVGQYQISSPAPRALVSTSRVWMAMDASVQPPRAEHYAGELLYTPRPGWQISAETYYKHQIRLYTVDYSAPLKGNDAHVYQSAFLSGGEGYAWGLGGRIERRWGSNRVSVGAERSHVERGTAQFNFNYYVVPWNEPWRFSAGADLQLLPRLVLLARWQGVWGQQWAFRQAYYDYLVAARQPGTELPPALRAVVRRHIEAYDLDQPIENRLPPYHRLDLGLAYGVALGAAQIQYRLDAINVLDRRNVADRQLVGDRAYYEETGLLRAEDRFLLPFTLVWAVRLTL